MTAKLQFFEQVLGGLKERSAYFSRDSIQAAADGAGLALKKPSLSVYVNQAVKQCIIHDAGRGWYSRLAESVKLDRQPVAKLVRLIEKKFPLLDFHCWSTAQMNPWMHHLIGKGVAFVNVDAEALEPVWEALRDAGYDPHLNPTGKAREQFAVREKTVVVRRRTLGAPRRGRSTCAVHPPFRKVTRTQKIFNSILHLTKQSHQQTSLGRGHRQHRRR